MRSSLLHATLSIGVVIGVATGCASGGRSSRTQPAAQPMVTSEDIDRNQGMPIEQVLQAKVPGLIVSRTNDGGIAVQIRGPNSFYSGGEPLYVIDDIPMKPGPGGALTGVNPYDIATIKVLKDPADTGIYGIRGANGVIVVTTKKPFKSPE